MKRFKIVTAFILLLSVVKAQDSTKHFELGATMITYNSGVNYAYSNQHNYTINYPNGLFFRYTKKRLGVRALASYSQNSFSSNNYTPSREGQETINNFIIGIGGQLSIFKKKDWYYTFLDLQYRNKYSSGFYNGDFAGGNYFTTSINGLQSSLGIGFKIKVFKIIYISPEIAYMFYYGKETYTTTSLIYYGSISKSNSTSGEANLMAKIHLTVKF